MRATEAYSPTVGAKDIVPVHSSMLVTERLPEAVWDEINWSGRQSVSAEHPFLHLQRTSDDRITIGGDDARIPYKWASSTSAEATATENVHRVYREELDRLFPVLRDHRIETSWQGIFGAPGTGRQPSSSTGRAVLSWREAMSAKALRRRTSRPRRCATC